MVSKNPLKESNRKALCIVSTPFQMLALICFITAYKSQFVSYDLLISNASSATKGIAERAMRSGLFDHVFVGNYDYPKHSHLGIWYLANQVFKRVSSDSFFYGMYPGLEKRVYDTLLCSCASRLSLDAKRLCVPDGNSIFFDDGLGTHTGLVFGIFACFDSKSLFCKSNRDIKKRIKWWAKLLVFPIIPKKQKLNITDIYMFYPTEDDCNALAPYDIHPLQFNQESLRIIEKVLVDYDKSVDNYINNDLFFLTIPNDFDESINSRELKVLNRLMAHYGDRLMVKLHPRRDPSDFFAFSNCLLENYPWELAIGKGYVSSKSVLIGLCSSAQIMPKLLFGIEPFVVFLDEIIRLPDYDIRRQSIDGLRKSYEDKDRIATPSSISELIGCLNEVINAESVSCYSFAVTGCRADSQRTGKT